ncbi:hypothetical protein IFM89_006115, partial [Coptis chinensis]
ITGSNFLALQKTWCVGKPSSDQAALQANIDYVCGSQVDYSIVLKVACPCYTPDTVLNHTSIAMNLYYQSKGRNKWNCYFNNSGLIVVTDPSKSFLQSSISEQSGFNTGSGEERLVVLVIGLVGKGTRSLLCLEAITILWCCLFVLLRWGVGLVVVGPEVPLVAGLANDLVKAEIPTFGPSAEAAALEGSKDFMKKLCHKYGIPTAKYQTFTNPSDAKQYIKEQGAPIVIKADGLAAGKGAVVAMTLEEAYEAVDSMLVEGIFGSAGCSMVIEELLEGEEASFFTLVDGENAIPLESAQDHKRVGDDDTGPNTGGMGAYSAAPILTEELKSLVMSSIILPTVKGMSAEGCKFVGVLYAGLMIEKTGAPKLIEYNVCFGDPECQVLMVRLESDLAQILLAACKGELSGVLVKWSPGTAMVVVMASQGYPGTYKKGTVIQNLEEAESVAPSVKIFHAGTSLDSSDNYIAVGVLCLG